MRKAIRAIREPNLGEKRFTVLVHSNSFEAAGGFQEIVRKAELLARVPHVSLVFTPTENPESRQLLSRSELLIATYRENQGNYSFETPRSMHGFFFFGPSGNQRFVAESTILNFELATIQSDDQYLIVAEADPILETTASNSVYTLHEFLNLLRIYLVNHEIYTVNGRLNVNEGAYYLYRFKTQFPLFQYSWHAACNILRDDPRATDPVFNQLDGMSRRLSQLCRSYDKTARYALAEANNDTFENSIYHFNFHALLTTGIYDDIAHIITQIYELDLNPTDITLPHTRFSGTRAGNVFLRELRNHNPALADILSAELFVSRTSIIYPIRDAVVHQRYTHGYTYQQGSTRQNHIYVGQQVPEFVRQAGGNLDLWGINADSSINLYPFLNAHFAMFREIFETLFRQIDFNSYFETDVSLEPFVTEIFRQTFATQLNFGEEPIYF